MDPVIESYNWEEIHKVLGKINNQIESLRQLNHKKPKIKIKSETLDYKLRNYME